MKGHIIVEELNNTGNFVSELDYDKAFIDDTNKKGYFKMLIQPIKNCADRNEIRYRKVENGFKVSGEAYIITGRGEKEIDKKVNEYRESYKNVLMKEVKSDAELW